MARLYYKIFSCTEYKKTSQEPLILIRGLGRSMEFWLDFIPVINQYFDIICIDLLGTGGSFHKQGRSSIHEFSLDIIETIQQIGICQFHLLGISMGGMISLEIMSILNANNYKLKICSCIVISSSARGLHEKRIYNKAILKIIISLRHGLPKHKDFIKYLISKKTQQEKPTLAIIWDSIWKENKITVISLLRQLYAAARFTLYHESQYVKCPLLFIVSKDDALVPWKNTLKLWQYFSWSNLFIITQAGHDLTSDNPYKVASIVQNFIKML